MWRVKLKTQHHRNILLRAGSAPSGCPERQGVGYCQGGDSGKHVSPVISRSGPWNSTQECYVGWHPPAFAVVSFRTCRVLSLFSNLTCKRGSVGQSEALLISRSWVRFRFKPENSNSHGFELHRLSIKSTKILLKVIKAIFIIKVRVNVVY